jgi:hypothetical protein
MARFTNPLAHVRVASPCKADWDEMIGTDRVRFCGQCSLNVYNLSAMTRDQAESVIAANEGRLCVRFYRRGDGSIITQDCPVGLRAARQRVSSLVRAGAAAVFAFLASLGIHFLIPAIFPSPRQPFVTMGAIAVNDRPWVDVVVVGTPPPQVFPAEVGEIVLKQPRTARHKTKD